MGLRTGEAQNKINRRNFIKTEQMKIIRIKVDIIWFFLFANLSMTLLLKLSIKFINNFSYDKRASALSLSSDIEFLKNVLILFSMEKRLSASVVDIGIVISNLRNFTVSLNVSFKLFTKIMVQCLRDCVTPLFDI